MAKLETFLEQTIASPVNKKLLAKAYNFGKKAHAKQLRLSGEPYFEGHCVKVAQKLQTLGFDTPVICAGLLHDTIEDTDVTYEQLEQEFGTEIANLVKGVSKLGKAKYRGYERRAESLRRFFMAVTQDVRVVVLKLADRWHNLETLQFLPPDKQHRIALESIMIYAPLASRLGMGKIVSIINDLSFPYAYPKEYQKTKTLLENHLNHADHTITRMYKRLVRILHENLGYLPSIDRRVKGIYSLYKKLERNDWNKEAINDLVALRVILKTVSDCYQVLGNIHSHWRPVPGKVKDYIATPKANGYKSLHTTVFSGDGYIVEIQLRTKNMHAFNEFGIASHHSYKYQDIGEGSESLQWLEQLRELGALNLNPSVYLKKLKGDLFKDRIFVFTPKGDVIDLPIGATVLDFAYAIHSDIGDSAVGGRINGKLTSLKTKLNGEDVIEILTGKKAHPSAKWLKTSITSLAHNRIRRWLNKTNK